MRVAGIIANPDKVSVISRNIQKSCPPNVEVHLPEVSQRKMMCFLFRSENACSVYWTPLGAGRRGGPGAGADGERAAEPAGFAPALAARAERGWTRGCQLQKVETPIFTQFYKDRSRFLFENVTRFVISRINHLSSYA